MFGRQIFAVVFPGKKHIGLFEIGQRNIRRVAMLRVDRDVFRLWFGLGPFYDFAEGNSFPKVVKLAPVGDTVEVSFDLDARQAREFRVTPFERFSQACQSEFPPRRIEGWNGTLMQNWPFQS